jgi:hypothetical protein
MKQKTSVALLLLSIFFVCFNVQTSGKTIKQKSNSTRINKHKSSKNKSHTTHYHFSGYMTDNKGDHPIELDFDVINNWLTNIVYKNVTLGGKIHMKCTKFSGIYMYPDMTGSISEFLDDFTIVGKDGRKDFIMSMTRLGNCVYEGTARVGSKRLTVTLYYP